MITNLYTIAAIGNTIAAILYTMATNGNTIAAIGNTMVASVYTIALVGNTIGDILNTMAINGNTIAAVGNTMVVILYRFAPVGNTIGAIVYRMAAKGYTIAAIGNTMGAIVYTMATVGNTISGIRSGREGTGPLHPRPYSDHHTYITYAQLRWATDRSKGTTNRRPTTHRLPSTRCFRIGRDAKGNVPRKPELLNGFSTAGHGPWTERRRYSAGWPANATSAAIMHTPAKRDP